MRPEHLDFERSDRELTEVELAYIAGLIDGEGSIGLARRPSRKYDAHQASAYVNVTNTNLDLLKAVGRMVGEGHITQNRHDGLWKNSYQLVLMPNALRRVLPQIAPYLIAKKRQAELVLEYLSLIHGRRGIAAEDRERAVEIREAVQALNTRGDDRNKTAPRCTVDGCSHRSYLNYAYCYHHWLQHGEKEVANCRYCGKEMELRHPIKQYCSETCLGKAYYREVIKPRREAGIKKKDEQIGFEFPFAHTLTCPCGETFKAKYRNRVYCDACRANRIRDNVARCKDSIRAARQQQRAEAAG